MIEVHDPLPPRAPRSLVAGHRAADEPVAARLGLRHQTLAEIPEAHALVADRVDRVLELWGGSVAHDDDLEVGVRLR
jgi:hypothetical protein